MNAIESQRRMRMAAQEKAEGDKILVVKVRLFNIVPPDFPSIFRVFHDTLTIIDNG